MRANDLGFTLIEVLVVIAIIGLLIAMVFPAVQSAREASRRTACQNNMRQIAVALQSYAGRRGHLPSLYNGSFLPRPRDLQDEFHFHSWRSAILAELEQPTILASLDWAAPASDAKNQAAINCEIPVYVCPSTNNSHAIVLGVSGRSAPTESTGTAARSDYEAIGGVYGDVSPQHSSFDLSVVRFGAWGEPKYDVTTGQSLSYRTPRFAAVTDGLSHTLLVGERGGRPDIFDRGKAEIPYPYVGEPSPPDWHQAAWGISTNFWWYIFWDKQSVNETNRRGIYSFHPGGANVAFADGSVRFLAESVSPSALSAMATRAEADGPIENCAALKYVARIRN
jgi:prepilin-type N-terminal cleavage/methylation domain-containing protein/prepilin-type processing-associated H-X9-DG protein